MKSYAQVRSELKTLGFNEVSSQTGFITGRVVEAQFSGEEFVFEILYVELKQDQGVYQARLPMEVDEELRDQIYQACSSSIQESQSYPSP